MCGGFIWGSIVRSLLLWLVVLRAFRHVRVELRVLSSIFVMNCTFRKNIGINRCWIFMFSCCEDF
jgi:hypothetical protein